MFCKSHLQWGGNYLYCVVIGICELENYLLISMDKCIYLEFGINILSAGYIYVPQQYNYAVSTCHRYCNYMYCLNYILLSASPHRTVQCSEQFDCAVLPIVIAVQHSAQL